MSRSEIELRGEIEDSFVRMLAMNGLPVGVQLSREDRRERIRAAIIEHKLKDLPYDAAISYGEAYRLCYSRSVALRDEDCGV